MENNLEYILSLIMLNIDFARIDLTGDLTKGEYLLLRHIYMRENTAIYNMSDDLSNVLSLSKPSITRLLNDLENKKLIKRQIDLNDRRRIRIDITNLGFDKLKKVTNNLNQMSTDIINTLRGQDKLLLELMNSVLKTLKSKQEVNTLMIGNNDRKEKIISYFIEKSIKGHEEDVRKLIEERLEKINLTRQEKLAFRQKIKMYIRPECIQEIGNMLEKRYKKEQELFK
ncbi:MAG: MarR family transcriptional regulator [Erysipelotrichales bacterium]|nr:MarR family transcriptional regulator [Erysipelotrichales bacterium]